MVEDPTSEFQKPLLVASPTTQTNTTMKTRFISFSLLSVSAPTTSKVLSLLCLLFTFNAQASWFQLRVSKMFTPEDEVSCYLYRGYGYKSKETTFQMRLYRVEDVETFVQEEAFYRDSKNFSDSVLQSLNLQKEWKETLRGRSYNEHIELGQLPAGVYVLEAFSETHLTQVPILVSDYGLLSKTSQDETLLMLVDKNNEAIEGFDFFLSDGTSFDAQYRTDDKLASFKGENSGTQHLFALRNGQLVASQSYFYNYASSKQVAYVFTDRPAYRPNQTIHFQGVLRLREGFSFQVPTDSVQVSIIFKGNDEGKGDDEWGDPWGGDEITEIRTRKVGLDEGGSFTDSLVLDGKAKLGTYKIIVEQVGARRNWWDWNNDGFGATTFQLQEYKKPEYEVKVALEKSQYQSGDILRATVRADYFFGAPVQNGSVEYFITRTEYYRPWWEDSPYAWWYRGWYSAPTERQTVQRGEGTLQADGSFEIVYPTAKDLKWNTRNYRYTVRASVRDASRRNIGGSSSTIVAHAAFTLSAYSPKYFYEVGGAADDVIIRVKTADFSGNAVSAPVKVRVYDQRSKAKRSIEFQEGRTDAETGETEIRFPITQTGYFRVEVTGTDERGREITDETSIYVTRKGDDDYWWWSNDQGTTQLLTDKKVYESGEPVNLLLYVPQHTDALVTVSGTTFAYKQIHRFDPADGKGKTLQLSLPAEVFGKVDVGIDYVAEGKHYHRNEAITVIPKQKYLDVTLEFDRESYLPTTQAVAEVIVRDHEGNPVPNAQVTLSTADQSIYSLYPETTADIREAFYESPQYTYRTAGYNQFYRSNQGQEFSVAQIKARQKSGVLERGTYLPDDKDFRFSLSRRSYDKSVVYGFVVDAKTGEPIADAKIKVAGKAFRTDEHGYYALSGFKNAKPKITFSANDMKVTVTNLFLEGDERALLNVGLLQGKPQVFEVLSDEELQKRIDRYKGLLSGEIEIIEVPDEEMIEEEVEVQLEAEEMSFGASEDDSWGADGGAMADEMAAATASPQMAKRSGQPSGASKLDVIKKPNLQQPTLRKNFKDAIYWNPSLKTDENGIAYANIQLPDNLTTWRTFAKVITADTEVGQTMAKVVVKKNLLVRLETPRFLKVGDELLAATTIHNYLPRDENVTVRLKANGLVVEGSERKIRIPANGEQRLDWKVGAKWALEAKLTVEALTDEESDAKQLKFPVHPHGLEMVIVEATQARDKAEETLSFTLPEGIDPNTASLELDVSPSIASALLSSMDQLIGYPYGCTEQTMSRFLPNVLVANTLQTLGTDYQSSIDEAELKKMTAKGLERLAELQHNDDGWGWWENDATHPFFTAHVTNGLFLAKEVGYDVPEDLLSSAKAALRRQIEKETTKEGTTHAYEMRVAVRVGMEALWEKKRMPKSHLMNAYDKALWLQAATDLGETKLQKMLLKDLEETAISEGRLAYWGGESFYYRWHDDRVETTANVVQALLQIDSEHPLIAPAVQWLMSQRRGVAWHNTRQTAVTIFALNELLKSELQTDTKVAIFVNGQAIAKHKFDPKSAFERGKTYTFRNEKFWVSLTGGGATDKLKVLKVGKNEIRIVQKGKGTAYVNAKLRYFHDSEKDLPEQKDAPFEVERTYFKLVPKVNKEGNIEYEKEKVELTKVNSGDVLFVKVKVKTKSAKENVLIEDPIPAGCEFIRDVKPYIIADEPEYDGQQSQRNWWDWEEAWYSHKEFRDQHFAMTITELSAGEYEYSYLMKAELLGTFKVTPSIAQRMYYPEQRGWSEFVEVVIGE